MNSFPQQPLILVIDEDPQVLSVIRALLTSAGYTCRCSNTPTAAIQQARSAVPDLIICDTHLGLHSGLELCDKIKSDPPLRDVPLMFLSGSQMPDIIRRHHEAGGAYHLRKPFDPDVLVKLVDRALCVPCVTESHGSSTSSVMTP